MNGMNRRTACVLALILLAVSIAPAAADAAGTMTLRIIATSDLHGKFMPWDYALNEESGSGSMAQLASAIAMYRTEATLLVDAGDIIQDNAADIFLAGGSVHPMILAMNALGYDAVVTGNHEYNYGMDVLRKTVADLDAKVLTGNVTDEYGRPVADAAAVFEVGGARVAVIGMVTPNILRWDAVNLAGCTVSDPLAETRACIDALEGRYDVLVGVFHMGLENEYGVQNSGVTDILNVCPEFDVMVSAHDHTLIPGTEVNGVLVVQNRHQAQTMAVIDLTLERDGAGWKVTDRTPQSVTVAGFAPDPAMSAMLAPYHAYALADAERVIGRLEGGPLAPANEIAGIPAALTGDTALIDLIQKAQLHFTGARVSSAAPSTADANLEPGEIRKHDTSVIYRFTNTLYRLRMTGAQLKKYMEWAAGCYNTWQPGDLTISFDPGTRLYNCDLFEGVCYEINVAAEPGSRVEHLTWPDGTPVADGDVFDIAVNNYRANSHLLVPGEIYEEDDMPVLLDADVHIEIGGLRELVGDYIADVMDGVITPACSGNWRITGNDWDREMHETAVRLLAEGTLSALTPEGGGTLAVRPVTVRDVLQAAGSETDAD